MKHLDVLIIGAGCSGISCAEELHNAKVDFQVLEARDRIGGRIRSYQESDLETPIELGAEFIHGVPKGVFRSLEQLQIPFSNVSDHHHFMQKGKLVIADHFWDQIETITKLLKPKRKIDRSVRDFLKAHLAINSKNKKLFSSFVEGFQAADLDRIGEKGLADAQEAEDETLNGSRIFRTVLPYQYFIEKIAEKFLGRVHMQSELKEVQWKKGSVKVTFTQGPLGEIKTLSCKKLIVTVPLGVLKAETIIWNPEPKNLSNILEKLEMGHVRRVVFRFQDRFWEKLTKEPQSFFHVEAENDFPTWWSLMPLRTPHLVGWQGGPRAKEMADWSDEEVYHAALKTLSRITGHSLSDLNTRVESTHSHNWSTDPYSRGAYSYIGIDGMKSTEQIRKPFQDTIYFAGEGCATGPSRGTVHGAFDSGKRVAKKILRGKNIPR